jgi:pyruvate ferredoxin oxidoreductase beta subunit
MNTGIRGLLHPFGASTTTSPAGKVRPGANDAEEEHARDRAAHNIPYVATACPSYPIDLSKVKKRTGSRPAYLHIPSASMVESILSFQSNGPVSRRRAFSLYEAERGRYRLTIDFSS